MFEKIFNIKKVEANANYALFAGVFFTILSFITSYLLFNKTQSFVSVATILFSVALAMPVIMKFFESGTNSGTFLQKTKHLFDFYIYFFIGAFVVFFIIALIAPSKVLSSDQLFGTTTKLILPQSLGVPPPPIDTTLLFISIFKNNIIVMLIAFVLSLIYGAGSLLLIVLNASIFASSLAGIIRQTAVVPGYVDVFAIMACNMGIMFFHMIPEVMAYFIAAIAGGMLSSGNFIKTIRYSLSLFALSIVILLIGAGIEAFISRKLLLSATCLQSTIPVILITLFIFIALAFFEMRRSRHKV